MPRSIWKGAISFGLISIPVRLYGATQDKDVSFHQVHEVDGGRIKYQRVCTKCGQEVPFSEIAKGYEAPDGRMAVLTKQDLDNLPLSSSKAVEILSFVDEHLIDPVYFEKSYYLEAEGAGAKPYVLLRDALAKTGKAGLVKVALRGRESLALVRPMEDALVMDTMLWPDEVREPGFVEPPSDIKASKAEVTMAQAFIEQMSGEWNPNDYEDTYRQAVEELVNAKLAGAPLPEPEAETSGGGEVVDLVAALRASVEAAKKRREQAGGQPADGATSDEQPASRRKKAS